MPELPEVETVLRTLEKRISGTVIEDVEVLLPKIIEGDPDEFRERLTGQTFRAFHRRGKYLFFRMDDLWLMSHLCMEGKYFLQKLEDELIKHTHVIFTLSDGTSMRYNDVRRFGRMALYPPDLDLETFHGLGPEPLSDGFSEEYAVTALKTRKEPVKAVLLDQRFAAGIGNIYADEILAAAAILPERRAYTLTPEETGRLVHSAKEVLREAVKSGGTTIRSYTSSLGVTGLFQLQCLVHGQKTCRRCGGEVKRIRISGRSTYFCPECQR